MSDFKGRRNDLLRYWFILSRQFNQ